jgi:Domain of unknown function (DUF4384)
VKHIPLFLLALFVACAPAATRLETSGLRTSTVIQGFKPEQGEGANYKVGSQVSFSYTLARAGYITLVAYDESGRTYDIERSVAVKAGAQTLPRPDDRTGTGGTAAYIVDPPVGPQRVFLIYTDRAAPTSSRVSGNFKPGDLSGIIRTYISSTGASVYDVAETRFEVIK